MPVERTEIEVMFLRTRDEPAEMRRGWERLEAAVGLRGRKFFGPFDPATRKYRVCVQVREGDDPTALGLEPGTLPGGRYLRARLRGEPPEVYERIDPTFAALVKATRPDRPRPSLEFCRHRDGSTYSYPSPTRQRRRVSSPATESADDQPSRASVPLCRKRQRARVRDGYISQSVYRQPYDRHARARAVIREGVCPANRIQP